MWVCMYVTLRGGGGVINAALKKVRAGLCDFKPRLGMLFEEMGLDMYLLKKKKTREIIVLYRIKWMGRGDYFYTKNAYGAEKYAVMLFCKN